MASKALVNSTSYGRLDVVEALSEDNETRIQALEDSPPPVVPVIYAGGVESDGSPSFLPSGWSSSRTVLGVYLINFDEDMDSSSYSVVLTIVGVGNYQSPSVVAKTASSFTVHTRAVGTAFVDADFNFVLTGG